MEWSKGLNQLLEQKATKQFKGKPARTKQTLPVSKRHPQLQTERDREEGRKKGRGRNGKSGKLNRVVGENRREHDGGVGRKELHGGWERGQSALIKPAKLEFSNSE